MGTKVRVDQIPLDDFDDWDPPENSGEKSHRTRQSTKRREIEDILDERRLRHETYEVYDEDFDE